MSGRDPGEEHRASTPLELLFDLTFVVAVARAGIELHDALGHGQAGHALTGYAAVFFGLWWAWVNFTWFASAYDTDDVPYRLLTLLQMAGVLVFAAGIPAAAEHFDFAHGRGRLRDHAAGPGGSVAARRPRPSGRPGRHTALRGRHHAWSSCAGSAGFTCPLRPGQPGSWCWP